MQKTTKNILISVVSLVVVAAIVLGFFLFPKKKEAVPEPVKADAPLFSYARTEMLKTFNKLELGEKATPKREINNEHPLNLVNFYMSEDVSLFWNSIPESQRELSILLIIPSHVFLPTTEEALIKMEKTADECERLGIPYAIQNTMGEAFMEELMPLQYIEDRFAKRHKYFYGLNCAELYNGIEWRGETDSNLTLYVSQAIQLCAKYGSFFIWTDTNMRYEKGMLIEWLEGSETLYNTFKSFSSYIYLLCKDSSMKTEEPMPMPTSYSLMEGLWLSGLIGGWGIACDWWSFAINQKNGNASLFHKNDNLIDHYSENGFSYPENLFTMSFAYVMSKGGVCFKAEAPNMSMTVGGKPVAGFEYSMMPFLDSLINGRLHIPSKEEVLKDTKAVIVGVQNYPYYNYNLKESWRFPNSGELGIIPLLPDNIRLEERSVFEEHGIQLIEEEKNEDFFKELYPSVDSNTYATRTANQWYYINVVENKKANRKAKLYPTISGSEYFTINASEHTYAVVKETQDSLQFNINNYRTDKTPLLKGVTSDSTDDWVKISAEYLTLKEDGNPILDDTVKRKTTITIQGTYQGGQPEIVWLNNMDGTGKHNRPYNQKTTWDEKSKILTVKLEHNGPVNFDVKLDGNNKAETTPTESKKLAPTKTKNDNPVTELENLLSQLPETHPEDYTYYSYLLYDRAVSKAQTIVSERTYSISEIQKAAEELTNSSKMLVKISDSVNLLREAISADRSQYSDVAYNKMMLSYDRLLLELLSPKCYYTGKNDREALYLSKEYIIEPFTAEQALKKKSAVETYTNQLKTAMETV